jgi:hypothetical protein
VPYAGDVSHPDARGAERTGSLAEIDAIEEYSSQACTFAGAARDREPGAGSPSKFDVTWQGAPSQDGRVEPWLRRSPPSGPLRRVPDSPTPRTSFPGGSPTAHAHAFERAIDGLGAIKTECASVDSIGTEGERTETDNPTISADGGTVAFAERVRGTLVCPAISNGFRTVFSPCIARRMVAPNA